MQYKIIRGIAIATSVLLLVSGLRWLADPAGAAAGLGMALQQGLGLSSQIGDTAAFFIVAGGFGLAGCLRRSAALLAVPAALVGMAAVARVIAAAAHGADFATQFIVLEVIMVLVFVAAARTATRQ